MKYAVTAATLIGVWYILSGRFDLLHFGTGVVTALIIAANFTGWRDDTRFRPLRFLLYLPWLGWQVLLSNLRVARLVLSPGMRIRPSFLTQRPGVVGDLALTTLGSSITLTPGTLTVDVDDDEIFVHALDMKSAQDVRDGLAARRIARVFEEAGA
jgi:multicomponent Na+:H+ antiporter subunit E